MLLESLLLKVSNLSSLVVDAKYMPALSRLAPEHLCWTAASLRPGAVYAIYNEICINRRRCLVELGAGISTFYAAIAMRDVGGRVISVEHDAQWIAFLEGSLERLGLADRITFVHAPLVSCTIDGRPFVWYDRERVLGALEGCSIDCLVCDGPPAYRTESTGSRFPAVPVLRESLAPHFAIFVDDIGRRSTRAACRDWARRLDVRFRYQILRGGFAYAVKGPSYYTIW